MGAHEALARRWFEEVWNNENEDFIDQLMSPDVISHGLGPDTMGREHFHEFYRRFREPFSSVTVTIDRVIEAGDEIAFRGRAEAVSKGTGEPVVFDGAGFIRFKDGRIVEGWNFWDFLSLTIQTRVAPATIVEEALRAAAGA
jgi:ketosteroid isomerase-like protein